MREIRHIPLFLLFPVFVFYAGGGFQDASQTLETQVTLSVLAEPSRIPLNRTAALTVRIAWEGDLDLIEIGDADEPILTNLQIVGSSSANRVTGTSAGKQAIKEIGYILRGQNLGMAYVEPIALTYTDKRSGKSHSLMTQRIGVEVVSAVPEPGERRFVWMWVLLPVAVLGGFAGFVLTKRRKRMETDSADSVRSIIEESYLCDLKETVDLTCGDRLQAFDDLSKLFRRYITDKFGIPAMEATTSELIRQLRTEGLDESLSVRCESFLTRSDVIKFSGQEATQAELEEAYTTVETVLESHLAEAREAQRKADEAASRKKKWKGLRKRSSG